MPMFRNKTSLTVTVLLVGLFLFAASSASAQSSNNEDSLIPDRRQRDDQPKNVKEYLAKQRAEKAKKDHEELLKRGDELVVLTEQLEAAFEKTNGLSGTDREKLESLEKLVTRIRKGLGGGDEEIDNDEPPTATRVAERQPSTLREAFDALKERTSKLVDELKKTTRFTVSALAIQSSNSVLKIVRFLRLRK